MKMFFSGFNTKFTAIEDIVKDASGKEFNPSAMLTFYHLHYRLACDVYRFKKHRKAWKKYLRQA